MRFRSLLPFAAALTPALFAQTQLPDRPGNTTVKKICGQCHEITTVISSRRTKIGWEQMVEDMISRGAEGTDDEMSAVVEFLSTWFGKINVNTASAGELQKTLGISEKDAQAILSYRAQNGKYKNFDELMKTPGVNPETLREKRSTVTFSQ